MSVALLARHGRSFRLAGRLLPGAMLRDAAGLYAFCRTVDDLADGTGDPGAARAALRAVRTAIVAGDGGQPEAALFLDLRERTGVAASAALCLVDTLLDDVGAVRVADEAALLRYAYGAAGTVGLMMCDVLGARDPGAGAHAIDLGIAMQLTNIARDVVEDAARDRLYLPAAWLPAGLGPADVADAAGPVFDAVREVLARAERRYRSAELGTRHLPARVRPAIRAASRLYEEIGLRVLRRGPGYLGEGRCVVPGPRRLVVLAGCLGGRGRGGPHDRALHAALCGLPGAHA